MVKTQATSKNNTQDPSHLFFGAAASQKPQHKIKMSKPKPEEHISDRNKHLTCVPQYSTHRAHLNATTSFTAQFASRKALYAVRDEYHKKSGYKLAVKNSNKEQVFSVYVCHQHKAVEPKKKCPLQIRANSGKRSEYWTISPYAEHSHLCNAPASSKLLELWCYTAAQCGGDAPGRVIDAGVYSFILRQGFLRCRMDVM